MKINSKIILETTLLTVIVVFLIACLRYPPNARMVPLIIGIPTGLLVLIQIVLTLRKEKRDLEEEANKPETHKANFAYGFLFVLFLSVYLLGILPAFILVILWLSRSYYKSSWSKSLWITACATFIPFIIFTRVFNVISWNGLIYRLLF